MSIISTGLAGSTARIALPFPNIPYQLLNAGADDCGSSADPPLRGCFPNTPGVRRAGIYPLRIAGPAAGARDGASRRRQPLVRPAARANLWAWTACTITHPMRAR